MMKHVVMMALAVLCLTASSPARAQVSGEFCGDLEGIAENWSNLYPVGDVETCPDLCQAWEQSCRGAVRATKQCALGLLEQIGVVAVPQCTIEPTQEERAQCRRIVQAEIDALKGAVKLIAEEGFTTCSDAQQMEDCIAVCSSPE